MMWILGYAIMGIAVFGFFRARFVNVKSDRLDFFPLMTNMSNRIGYSVLCGLFWPLTIAYGLLFPAQLLGEYLGNLSLAITERRLESKKRIQIERKRVEVELAKIEEELDAEVQSRRVA